MSLIFTGGKKMEDEFYLQLHPETRLVISELHVELEKDLRITEVCRSDDDSERIYMEIAKKLMASEGKGLSGIERAQWEQLMALSPQGVRAWARLRPTWHKAWTAVDVGLAGWNPGDFTRMADLLHRRTPKPMWEVIMEPHGTGPHLHLARRDYVWLKDFPGSLRRAQGRKNPPSPQR